MTVFLAVFVLPFELGALSVLVGGARTASPHQELLQELGMEDWIPTKGKRGKRTTRSKKERAAVTESALGVVKKGSSSVMKKKGTEQAKKRASKLAPFKGVTIKNNRYVMSMTILPEAALPSQLQFNQQLTE